MKSFLVIGLGRFGGNLATTLAEMGNEVLVVDEEEERVQKIADRVTHAVVGDARDEQVLRSIGPRNFDCVVVALSMDMQSSTLVTLMLKEMEAKHIVSKAQSEIHMRILQKVGADLVVFPEKDMGMKVAQRLAMNNIIDYIELSDEFSIVEVRTPAKWVGKSLKELDVRRAFGINILAVKHQGDGRIDISPDPAAKLMPEDVLVLIGSTEDITRVTALSQ